MNLEKYNGAGRGELPVPVTWVEEFSRVSWKGVIYTDPKRNLVSRRLPFSGKVSEGLHKTWGRPWGDEINRC